MEDSCGTFYWKCFNAVTTQWEMGYNWAESTRNPLAEGPCHQYCLYMVGEHNQILISFFQMCSGRFISSYLNLRRRVSAKAAYSCFALGNCGGLLFLGKAQNHQQSLRAQRCNQRLYSNFRQQKLFSSTLIYYFQDNGVQKKIKWINNRLCRFPESFMTSPCFSFQLELQNTFTNQQRLWLWRKKKSKVPSLLVLWTCKNSSLTTILLPYIYLIYVNESEKKGKILLLLLISSSPRLLFKTTTPSTKGQKHSRNESFQNQCKPAKKTHTKHHNIFHF